MHHSGPGGVHSPEPPPPLVPPAYHALMQRARFAVLAVVLLAGACTFTRASAGHRPTPAAYGSDVSNCDKPAAAGLVQLSPHIGGRARIIRVHVPAGYTGRRPVALVLSLHGTGSSAARQ